jgi:hypothetical protein
MKPMLLNSLVTGIGLIASVHLSSAQVVISPALAAPPGTINTNSPGFKVKVVKVTGLQVNHVDIAESLIKGTRIDPNTGEPYFNEAIPGPNPDGSYTATTINYDGNLGPDSTAAGNFRNDEFFPGVDPSADDYVLEVTGFMQLPAGSHRLGVNSDDGFKLTIGAGLNPNDAFAVRVSGVDGTRGQANTDQAITIQTAGLYPFRLLYWERGGDARLELSNFTPGNSTGGTRYLANDPAQANAFKVYAETLVPFDRSFARLLEPAPSSTTAFPSPFLRVELQEQTPTITAGTARLFIDGNALPTTEAKDGSVITVTAQVTDVFAPASIHTGTLVYTESDGTVVTNTWEFTVSNYPSIPASLRVAAGDATKPGFNVRTYQMPHPRYPGNRGLAANAERALALGYNDPATGQPYENMADLSLAEPNGYFIEPETINYHDGGTGGSFPDDRPVPGIPGIEGTSDLFVVEVTAFLELQAGGHRFGVNSDDGFRVNAGRDSAGVILGTFNGTRGTADTFFDFVVPEDGVYPVRLTFSDNTGGGAGELFSVNIQTGEKTLINDAAVSTSIKAYRDSATSRPFISRVLPAQNYLFTFADQDVIIDITDGVTPVDSGSVTLKINGTDATVNATQSGNVTQVIRDSSVSNLLPSGVNALELSYAITEGGTPTRVTNTWSYTVPPYTRVVPAANKVAASTVSGSGFIARTHQIDRSGDANQGNGGRYTGNGGNGNSMPRPEIQISEGYIDRASDEPFPNLAQPGTEADGTSLLDILNYNGGAGGNSGVYNADAAVPGLPGTGSSQSGLDNFVQEIHTYLELSAGAHVFAVNLDDGFIMSSSPNPKDTLGTFLGSRNPGGGNANPLDSANAYAGVFNVIVPEDGIYPIRLLWWQGGGGVNLEFMTLDPDTGVESLVNDLGTGTYPLSQNPPTTFTPTGVAAFPTYTGPERPWVKFSVYPLSSLWQNQHQQSGPGPILVKVAGGNPADIANESPNVRPFGDSVGAVIAGLGSGSVDMVIDGVDVTPTVTDLTGGDKLVSFTPNPAFGSGSTHTAGLVYAGTTNYWTFAVITNVVVPSGVAAPSSAADQTAQGFRVKVVQAASGLANTAERAETQLAGTPENVALPGTGPDGSHIVSGIINWNVNKNPGATAGAEIGNFQTAYGNLADEPVPGIPGTGLTGNPRFENIAAEIFAYLDLPAGYQKFGVGADDGFKVQIGTPGQTDGLVLFTIDRGAGPRDLPFAFITPEAGLYPVRLVWYQGGGGGNIEFFTYGPNNEKIPVNGTGPNAVKAYYNITGGIPNAPEITSATVSGGSITIIWTGGGTLESRADFGTGAWTSTGDSDGSFSEPTAGMAKFYRVSR